MKENLEAFKFTPRVEFSTFAAEQRPRGSVRFKDKFWQAVKWHLIAFIGTGVLIGILETSLPFLAKIKFPAMIGAGIYGGARGFQSAV